MSFSIQNTNDERTKAAKQAPHVQVQKGVQIDQDALASAALIYGAIDKLGDDVKIGNVLAKKLMMKLATKLSYNTLVPWYKGAAMLIGNRTDIRKAFGTTNPLDGTLVQADSGGAFMQMWWATDDEDVKTANEALRALRRTYGNGWEGSLAVATALETQQLKKQRDAYWEDLPAETFADNQAGVGTYLGRVP